LFVPQRFDLHFYSADEDFRWRSKRLGTNNFLIVIDEFITEKYFRSNEFIRNVLACSVAFLEDKQS